MMPIKKNQSWLPSIFNDFLNSEWIQRTVSNSPAVNVIELDDLYKVEVATPGMAKNDFTVKVDNDNELVILMEKKDEKKEDEKNGKYLRHEFSYTQFKQTLLLPDNIEKEKIEAQMNNGILTITIPKSAAIEKEKNARIIEIK